MHQVGPFRLEPDELQSPYEALVESIVYQQLTGKAAATILGRVKNLSEGKPPSPEEILAIPDETLRQAGLSRPKVAALRDLAHKTLDGTVPSLPELAEMNDEHIVERLTSIRGVGRWTVEMLLMFRLGRMDVLPANDLGVRKGFNRVYGSMPTPKELLAYGERWRPYRTVASWYLWRATELN